MSATDELRRILDERGVEYKRHYLNTSWYVGMKLYMATDDVDGTLTVDNLTPEQAIAATLSRPKAKAHPYGYEPDTGAFDCTRCECGCINDISATYCNDCGGEIEIDMYAEKEIYHIPCHLVFAEKHDDGSLEFGGKRYVAATLGSGTLTAAQVRECVEKHWHDLSDEYDMPEATALPEYSYDWQAIADELNAALGTEINGDTSDGYHTFDELYYHRTALFACLVALQPRQMAFKSWKHSDGTMYEGFFIAGIYTSGGWCTYHCEAKWWPLFDCHEQEFAPEWDGHTPSDAIHRLMSDFLPSQDVSGEVSE